MAATKRATVKAKVTPADSSYSLKGMDRVTWTAFVTRAKSEGRTVRWLLDSFIRSYAHHEPLHIDPS